MSAYVIVEFTVKDPDVYREKYAGNAGKSAKEYGAEILANSDWEILDGVPMLSSGVIVQFPNHETALRLPKLAGRPTEPVQVGLISLGDDIQIPDRHPYAVQPQRWHVGASPVQPQDCGSRI